MYEASIRIPSPSSGQPSPHDLERDRVNKLASGWNRNIYCLTTYLETMAVSDAQGQPLQPNQGFHLWAQATDELRAKERTIYLVGNGASASMASHLAADLAKNGQLHTEVFSDLSLITAIANDISFEDVFAVPLRRRMKVGDMLVAISSSGRSPNVLKAVEEARGLGGMVVTLSAMGSGNPLRRAGDLNFYVSSPTYGEAETCHAAVLHYWMDLVSVGLASNGELPMTWVD